MTADVLVCAAFGCVGLFLGIGGFFALRPWPTAASFQPAERIVDLSTPIVCTTPAATST